MSSAPTLPQVSVEEYLRTHYEVECEYVDGVLIEKRMGSRTHGLFQGLLYTWLSSLQKEHGIRIYLEQHIRLHQQDFAFLMCSLCQGITPAKRF